MSYQFPKIYLHNSWNFIQISQGPMSQVILYCVSIKGLVLQPHMKCYRSEWESPKMISCKSILLAQTKQLIYCKGTSRHPNTTLEHRTHIGMGGASFSDTIHIISIFIGNPKIYNEIIKCCYQNTVYPKKYAHGFVVLCFVVVMQSFIMNSHEVFIHIHQGCFAGTGAIVRLPQCQWSKPDGYGKISQCITTTKHSKAKTVCIFLGIYCRSLHAVHFQISKK